jgi:hypothetical protein
MIGFDKSWLAGLKAESKQLYSLLHHTATPSLIIPLTRVWANTNYIDAKLVWFEIIVR